MTTDDYTNKRPRIFLRIAVSIFVLAIWFWTQSLIGTRGAPASGISDSLHNFTAGWNAYFYRTPFAANLLLITSSGLIDALGLFLLARWLFGPSIRPFFGLIILMALRQIMQALCSLLRRRIWSGTTREFLPCL